MGTRIAKHHMSHRPRHSFAVLADTARHLRGPAPNARGDESADPRRRLRWLARLGLGWLLALAALLVRAEWEWGAAYRLAAQHAAVERAPIAAPRGRLLCRDGTVLACDRAVAQIRLEYRWLESPPDPSWLASQARRRLPTPRRRDAVHRALAQQAVLEERAQVHRRLAQWVGDTPAAWQARLDQVQQRVERIARATNARRRQRVQLAAYDPRDAEPIVVAEQLAAHLVIPRAPLWLVAEIEAHRQRYPGVEISEVYYRQ